VLAYCGPDLKFVLPAAACRVVCKLAILTIYDPKSFLLAMHSLLKAADLGWWDKSFSLYNPAAFFKSYQAHGLKPVGLCEITFSF
jgi:hypothetical protein